MFSAIHLQHRKMITKCNNKLREIMKSCASLAKDWCSLFRERSRTRLIMLKNRKQQFTAETFDSSCSGWFSWPWIIEYLLKQPSSRLQTIKHWPFVKHVTCLQFVVRHTTAQKSSSPKAQRPKLVLYQKRTTAGGREINYTLGNHLSSYCNQSTQQTLEAQFNSLVSSICTQVIALNTR